MPAGSVSGTMWAAFERALAQRADRAAVAVGPHDVEPETLAVSRTS